MRLPTLCERDLVKLNSGTTTMRHHWLAGLRASIVASGLAITLLAGCDRPAEQGTAAESKSETTSSSEAASSSEPAPSSAPSTSAPTSKSETAASVSSSDSAPNPLFEKGLLTPAEAADGWISLFDGQSKFGWRSTHEDINWTIADGVLTADTGSNGALMTTVPFADFELVCEFRLSPGANSGIFLRSAAQPTNPTVDFYEVNLADVHPEGFYTGSLALRKKADVELKQSNVWQTLKMIAKGNKVTVIHDGKTILEFTDESEKPLLNGYIGLQKNSGKIEFRKVNLKPLDLEPLFNEKDLTGWKVVPGSKSEFKVVDGAIHAINGAGFLETEKTYQDFIFQTQVKTGAKDLNSGFFFRALPGTEQAPSHGYEVQVHNGIKDGNRDRPDNAGTGAIFRRVEARRVVSNDLEWCTITLVTAGPRMAVWVDGFEVVDWEDTRAADENPRKGRRDGAGHFSLQGHDPTTDVLFRKIQVKEQPAQ